MIPSKRKYSLIAFDHNVLLATDVTLDDLFDKGDENTPEYIFALQEKGDEILDMKIGDTMYASTSRDHEPSKGVLIRLK